MSIQVMSDLHIEFNNKIPNIHPDAKAIVLAGDTDVNPKYFGLVLSNIRKKTEAPIITVLGNHEYYGHTFPDILTNYRSAIQNIRNTYLLEKDCITVAGYNFLGTTLWTDYDQGQGVIAALKGMADFKYIYGITPEILIKEHSKCKNWLTRELRSLLSSNKKTVVVTHHVPSMYFAGKNYPSNSLDGAFYVNMDKVILDFSPFVWICGHTHVLIDEHIDKTRVVCNPLGYPNEKTKYEECLLV